MDRNELVTFNDEGPTPTERNHIRWMIGISISRVGISPIMLRESGEEIDLDPSEYQRIEE